MPRRELIDAVLGPVSSIDSNDKGFLDIQKKNKEPEKENIVKGNAPKK